MAVKLNSRSFDFAKDKIDDGKFVFDERDAWSEHQPSTADENRFIEKHGFDEYALWHLGVDDSEEPDTKGHYKFPYGDFNRVHRCGLLAAEVRASQRDYNDIRDAAHQLHEIIESRQ